MSHTRILHVEDDPLTGLSSRQCLDRLIRDHRQKYDRRGHVSAVMLDIDNFRRINDRYNPRRILRMILLGMKKRVLESDFIWLCSSCYTCQERCPQGVRITDLMTAVRNMASREGWQPSGIAKQSELIKSQGRLYSLDEFDDKKRKKAGLPSIPFTIEEVTRLLKD